MAGANHCRNRLLTLLRVGRSGPERADPPALGKTQGRLHCPSGGVLPGRRAVLLVDPGVPQLLLEPTLAVTAAAQSLRFRKRISRVIDIAELRESDRERVEVGLPLASPAALANFPRKIGGELRAAGREPADIAQRELLEPVR